MIVWVSSRKCKKSQYLNVEKELNYLNDIGVIDTKFQNVYYQVIVFEECT